MATYYVSPTGVNGAGHTGSISDPWLTIQYAVGRLSPDDILNIRSGTYNDRIVEIDFGTTGTSGHPITIQAFGSETVTITNGAFGNIVRFQDTSIQYVVLQRLIFDGAAAGGGEGAFVVNCSSSHISFIECSIRNGDDFGMSMGDGCTDILVRGCYIHHNGTQGVDGTWGHGIYGSADNCIIEYCHIYSNYGYGIHLYGVSDHVHDNIVRKNQIYLNGTVGNSAAGILLSHGADNIAYNNLIYSNLVDGFWFYSGADANLCYNNTIYNNTGTGIRVEFTSSPCEAKNNIVYSNGTDINDIDTTLVQATNLTTDPDFVDAGAADFHLNTGSDAIDTGTTLAAVPDDFDDVARPQNSVYDIGAYEYVLAGGNTTFPSQDVTASWVVPSGTLRLIGGPTETVPMVVDARAGIAVAGLSRAGLLT